MDNRFQQQIDKLENRFERLDDKVDNVKIEIVELRSDIERYTDEIVKHVSGDEKIVTEIMPTLLVFKQFVETDLKDFREIILKSKFEEINQKEIQKKKESFISNTKIVGGVLTAIGAIIAFYRNLKF
jgi:archaellum component FlaC